MVFRVHKTKSYTTICNSCIFDSRLTLKAKGLIVTMLALPEDWNYSIAGMVSVVREGESAIRAALAELKEYGYVTVSRMTDDKGKVTDWVYDIFENPDVENPHVDNPVVENQGLQNTNIQSTNEQIKKDINSSNDSFISKEKDESLSDEKPKKKKRFAGINPSKEEIEAYIKEKGYHITAESMINYYTDHGRFPVWRMANGNLVKDWKRCCGTFEDKWKERNENQPTYRRVNTDDPYREVAKAYDEEAIKHQEELHAKGRLSKADHDKLLEQLRESKGRAYQNLS